MKAIETRYNGHRFRSRTEARWAVLFDHLGVKYEYEREGYELSEGMRYLPDFWLPIEQCFVEIKGDAVDEHDWRKVALLVHTTGKPAYVLTGQPGYHTVALLQPHFVPPQNPATVAKWLDEAPSAWISTVAEYALQSSGVRTSGAPHIVATAGLALGPRFVDLDYSVEHGRLAHWTVDMVVERNHIARDEQTGAWCYSYGVDKYVQFYAIGTDRGECDVPDQVTRSAAFEDAIAAAKSARFEFGENGAG